MQSKELKNNKITISSELVYLLGILILSFSVAMIASTNFGVSMIVAPAYIVSQKLGFITFGQSEYIIQGLLFIVFCLLMKRFKPIYLFSFMTSIIYGAVLDFWRLIIPHFNPSICPPGSLPLPLRIAYFAIGMLLTSLAVSLFFRTYIYPQVYDFFVKCISQKFGIDRTKFKMAFDGSMLIISCMLTLVLFHGFVGIGVGTIVMTALNGIIIGFFGKIFDKYLVTKPTFTRLAKIFEV